MQNDGQCAVEVVADTSERTSSVDDQQQSEGNGVTKSIDVGLPPMVPVKAQERVCVQVRNEGRKEQTKVVGEAHSAKKLKLRKVKTANKVAAHVDRRRKWKAKASDSTGISQTSARMLFRCSCQLLRNQTLDYDVRAREMEERNAVQTREINEWEMRIRSLKRELEEYADEQSDESTDMALVEATDRTVAKAVDEQMNTLPFTTAMYGTVETSLPPAVIAAEVKLQEELRKRTQKVKEFCKSVPGFVQSQEEQIPRYF